MNEPRFLAMGTAGKALVALAKRFQILILFFYSTGYNLSLLQVPHASRHLDSCWETVFSCRNDFGIQAK